jgi:hypothetical protein
MFASFTLAAMLIPPTFLVRDATPRRGVDIRIHSGLVLINALVADRHGRVIAGLDGSRFRLFEHGQEQRLKYCAGEDAPVSIWVGARTGWTITAATVKAGYYAPVQ